MKVGKVNAIGFVKASLILCGFGIASMSQAVCDPSLTIVDIDMKAMQFVPAAAEICVGQTVRWTNSEPADVPRPIHHQVTFNPALSQVPGNVVLPDGVVPFDSGRMAPGTTFEKTFDIAGEYKYICKPHEKMGHLGRLTVVDPNAAVAPDQLED